MTEHCNPDPLYCDFYLAKKRRFCKSLKKPKSNVSPSLPQYYRYCPTHQMEEAEVRGKRGKRIPCPVNPNHSIYEHDVKKHVLVCPDRHQDPTILPYYKAGIHAAAGGSAGGLRSEEQFGGPEDHGHNVTVASVEAEEGALHHQLFSIEELDALGKKILKFFNEIVEPQIKQIPVSVSGDKSNKAHEEKGSQIFDHEASHPKSKKHSPQHEGLLALMINVLKILPSFSPEQIASTPPVDAIIEMGAGKGGLGLAIHEELFASKNSKNKREMPNIPTEDTVAGGHSPNPEKASSLSLVCAPKFFVVDRGNFRHKKDGVVRNEESSFVRLRIDIQDLDLNLVPELIALTKERAQPEKSEEGNGEHHSATVAAVGKHLCGACTDFAIHCASDCTVANVSAMCYATCCHHRCDLYFYQHLQMIVQEEEQAGNCVVIGEKRKRKEEEADVVQRGEVEEFPGTKNLNLSQQSLSQQRRNHVKLLLALFTKKEFAAMTRMTSWAVCGRVSAEKEAIGYAAKRLIDYTRVLYLQLLGGYSMVELFYYVPRDITKENCAIVCKR